MKAVIVVTAFLVAVSGCSTESDSSSQPADQDKASAPQTSAQASQANPPKGAQVPPAAQAESASRPSARQDPREVLRTLQQRLEKLSSVIVEYDTKVTYPPLRPGEQAIVRPEGKNFSIVRATGWRGWKHKFMLLDGLSRYEGRILDIEGAAQGPDWRPRTEFDVKTYLGDRGEYLGLAGDGKVQRATVHDLRALPGAEIEIALGLRAQGQTDRLFPEALAGMRLDLPDDERAVLSATDNTGSTHEWTFLRSQGYALKRYVLSPPESHRTVHEAVMDDFRDADGMIMPYSMVFASRTPSPGGERVNFKTEAKVTLYRISDPANTPEIYPIKWPKGARIWDRRKASQPRTKPTSRPATQPATSPTTQPGVPS